jgi:hypothetical protein
MKPGYKTTEFWLHNAVQFYLAAQIFAGHVSPIDGGWIMSFLAVGYALCRTILKLFSDGRGGSGGIVHTSCDAPALSVSPIARIGVVILAVSMGFFGCSSTADHQVRLQSEGITFISGAATTAALQNISEAKRAEVGQVVNQVAAAINDAASTPPDYSKLNELAATRLAAWKSPYAPLVQQLVVQILADAKESSAADSTPTAESQAVKAAMLGIRLATQQYVSQQ